MIEIDKEQQQLRNRIKKDRTFHDDLTRLVMDRFSYSYRSISGRYDAWRKAERQHLAYVDPSESDKAGHELFTGARDIIVPYSYAVLQTRLTYFFFSMVSKSPLVPIFGRGPDDLVAAKLMEVVQEYQMSETKAAAILYCFLQDCERYGVGILKNVWHSLEEERWQVSREPITVLGIKLYDRLIRKRNRVVTYEGNLPTNVSPYNFFPDPRVNITDVKKMEYCGHQVTRSWNYLKMAEANGEYFGIDEIQLVQKDNQSRSFEAEKINTESDLGKITNVNVIDNLLTEPSTNSTKDSANIKLQELAIRLIPRDHKISDRDYPQEYIITLANNYNIIKCEPCIYPEFPYYVGESNHDYAAPVNLSTMDMMDGLQDTLSWLFNSHMANVRKIVNNSMVVDPSKIEIKDMLKRSPVKIIRLKEDYWGVQGATADSVHQLQISDITRGHIQDSQIVMNLIQRVSAATDNIMGMVEEVKRTATETSSTINLATARLKLTAYLYYTIALKPWFKAMVFNNQGLLSEDKYYRITDQVAMDLGYDPETIKNRVLVKPEELYGNFDFDVPPLDMPIDKANMAKVWQGIIGDVVQNPMLSGKFDIVPMFKQMIYNLGITNFKDYEVKTKVMPDQQVQAQAQAGNIAPIDQAMPVNNNQIQESLNGAANG